MNNHEGIIVKTISYSDSSKILYLITPNGMESLLAKGAKKTKSPLRHLTQTITKISYNKTKSKLPILTSGDIVENYDDIKQNLEAQTYVAHILELVYRTSAELDYEQLYDFLSKILDSIIKYKDPEFIGFVFELKYLYLMGLGPIFKHCAECESTERIGFDIYKGGAVCKDHTSSLTITESTVIISLYKLYFYQFDGLFEIDRRQVRTVIDNYYDHFLNFKSKSREMIKNIWGY